MIQRFIELGEGYSDIYELLQLTRSSKERAALFLAFHTEWEGRKRTSIAVAMKPTDPGDFQPIYICREGIPSPEGKTIQRYELFADLAAELGFKIIEMDVRPSGSFADPELYYQYLIGILRMNRLIAPLQ